MKTFKQFLKTKKPKEEHIFNGHGEHAHLKSDKKHKEEHIFNGHGEHSKRKVSEGVQSDMFGHENLEGNNYSYQKHFLDNDRNSHLGSSTVEQMSKLHELHPLHHDHKNPLYTYSSDSRDLNSHLVDRNRESKKPDKIVGKHNISKLDNSFQPSAENFHTYSGAGFDLRNVKPAGYSAAGNKVYKLPAYMSSSHDKEIAARFARLNSHEDRNNQIIHFEHDVGHPVAVIGKHSAFHHENETLIPRTDATPEKYHIEHLHTTTYKDDDTGTEYDVHHVKRIPKSEIFKHKRK